MSSAPAPVEYGVAESADERRAAYRLRFEELVARGWGDPAEFPDGLERDEYDDDAVLLVGRSGGRVVATVRLIVRLDHVARLLPEYGLVPGAVPLGRTGVAGRLLIAPPLRRSREPVVGLLVALWRAAVDRRLARAVSFQTENSIRWCRVHGIPLKAIGAPIEDRGELRRAVLIDEDVVDAFVAAASTAERTTMPLG